jgi:hypothetical protein
MATEPSTVVSSRRREPSSLQRETAKGIAIIFQRQCYSIMKAPAIIGAQEGIFCKNQQIIHEELQPKLILTHPIQHLRRQRSPKRRR